MFYVDKYLLGSLPSHREVQAKRSGNDQDVSDMPMNHAFMTHSCLIEDRY